MADRNFQARVKAVVEIVHAEQHSASLVALAQRHRRVRRELENFLDLLADENDDDIPTRLEAFRNLPREDIDARQNGESNGTAFALLAINDFFTTFRAYVPATVVSSSEDDDSVGNHRPLNLRRRPRESRQSMENANKRLRRNL